MLQVLLFYIYLKIMYPLCERGKYSWVKKRTNLDGNIFLKRHQKMNVSGLVAFRVSTVCVCVKRYLAKESSMRLCRGPGKSISLFKQFVYVCGCIYMFL